MNVTVEDLRSTIVPKSDQLNSEQLLAGPITVTVTDVRVGSSDEQPISVHYEGENGRPFKPCKTMRKVLILGWGPDGREWVGQSMTLYNDPLVKFGGAEVGGIRISHMTGIPREIKVSLTATKGKKALHTIERLVIDTGPKLHEVLAAITTVKGQKSMAAAEAMIAQLPSAQQPAAARALAERLKVLKGGATPAAKTLADYTEDMLGATSSETAALVLDEARSVLSAEDCAVLAQDFERAWQS